MWDAWTHLWLASSPSPTSLPSTSILTLLTKMGAGSYKGHRLRYLSGALPPWWCCRPPSCNHCIVYIGAWTTSFAFHETISPFIIRPSEYPSCQIGRTLRPSGTAKEYLGLHSHSDSSVPLQSVPYTRRSRSWCYDETWPSKGSEGHSPTFADRASIRSGQVE